MTKKNAKMLFSSDSRDAKNLKQTNRSLNSVAKEIEADVLYQKLGDKWFAFSLIDDEMFFGELDQAPPAQKNKTAKTEIGQ